MKFRGFIHFIFVALLSGYSAPMQAEIYSVARMAVDTSGPQAICDDPPQILLDANGVGSIQVSDIFHFTGENLTYSETVLYFDCTETLLPAIRTVTVTDAQGKTASCIKEFDVVDLTPPTLICKDTTLELSPIPIPFNTSALIDTLWDNCGILPNIQLYTLDCDVLGTHPVTIWRQDISINIGSCISNITVVDHTPPTLFCHPTLVSLDANGTGQVQTGTLATILPDLVFCGETTLDDQTIYFSCANIGMNEVTITATDAHGNSSSCTANVQVLDLTLPVLTCQDITVHLDANGSASTAGIVVSITDNCSTPSVKTTPATVDCFIADFLGQITVVAIAQSSFCTATVTVVDDLPPVLTCKNPVIGLQANGLVTLQLADVLESATDNCGVVSSTISGNVQYTCNDLGLHLVTITATDKYNNAASCQASVTIVDNLSPTLVCKNALISLNAAGQAMLTVDQINNGSFDNCAIVNYNLSQSLFTCANLGANTIFLIANDAVGNKGICSATVSVSDPILPLAKCKNISANLGSNGLVTVPAAAVDNGSSDNCAFNLSLTPSIFNCGQTGLNTVTLRATDAGGNSASCTAKITIKDVSPPIALCKNATVFLNNAGVGTLQVNQLNNGSTDNCSVASMTLSQTQFNCSEIQGSPWTVSLTLKDASNNSSTCSAQVTVKDAIAPTALCENVSVELGTNGKASVYGAALAGSSTDNCSVWSYSPIAKVYTSANIGDNNLNITVKDWSGNASTCNAVVTVYPHSNFGAGSQTDPGAMLAEFTLHVFPNPSIGDVSIEFVLPADQVFQLQMFDLSSRLVWQFEGAGQKGENRFPIRAEGLRSGAYVLAFQTEGLKSRQRLMVQKG